RAGFLGVARGRENLSWNFHRTGVDTAAHRSATAGHRVVKGASCSSNRIEEDENILACFDQALGALDRELGNTRVTFDVTVIRAGDDLSFRMRPLEIG